MAFAYAGFFDLTGLISKVCLLMGFEGFHMDVLNRSVLGLVLAFSLFPYLFIISKVYLESASRRYIEAAETLGLSRFSIFRRVVLPLSSKNTMIWRCFIGNVINSSAIKDKSA